MRTLINRNIH